jgi:hypothetical protein
MYRSMYRFMSRFFVTMVTRYMYRDTIHKHAEPTGFAVAKIVNNINKKGR